MITEKQAAAELLRRRRARASLLPFIDYTHPSWDSGEHHAKICEALEDFLRRVERKESPRLAIFAPPRHSKSEIASKRFPAWVLGRHPDWQIIACSYNADLATDFGREVRNLVTEDEYRAVFPDTELAQDSKAASRWNTSKKGAYVAAGVRGGITGKGAHIAIIDDPVKDRAEADSPVTQEGVWGWYTSTLRTRLMPGGGILLMLTRWHEQDLAGKALERGGWDVLKLPAIRIEDGEEKALWPEWYNLEALRKLRDEELPARDWSALYQQEPRTETGSYIKREWFGRYDEAPERLSVYMASDFAVTAPREGSDPDWTEHGVFGIDSEGDIYVLDWWGRQTTADEWIESLLDLFEKHKPIAWFGEGGVIRRSIEPFLRKRMQERRALRRCEWITSAKDKATRGRAFQARASMGKIWFPQSAWADRLIDQCVGFPGATHDDIFDAMSLMCLVVDQAHAAIEAAPKPRKRERYSAKPERANTWKTA